MGHLINPIAFRLGINKSWESTWFLKNNYYAEFLHNTLNIRNFLYYIFLSKLSIESGLLLSEIRFFKVFKKYVVNIYLYHLELEKISYKYMNNIYSNYYKKTVLKKPKKLIFPKEYWFLQNVDLYALIHVFYNIFFFKKFLNRRNIKRRRKWLISKKPFSEFFFQIDDDIRFLINKFNQSFLIKIKNRNKVMDLYNLCYKNIRNKLKKCISAYALPAFKNEMIKSKKKFGKNFRYNYYKLNLIKSNLEESKDLEFFDEKIQLLLEDIRLPKEFLYDLFFKYLRNKAWSKRLLTKYLREKQIKKIESEESEDEIDRQNFNLFFRRFMKKYKKKGSIWDQKYEIRKIYYDDFVESSNNILKNSFLEIFLYSAKKVGFEKFRNYELFTTKWGYLIKFLKFLNTFEYKHKYKTSNFFLFLYLCLNFNLKLYRHKKKFFVRNMIYRILYVWLGKVYFFPFFKYFSNLLRKIFILISSFKEINFNYFFISVNDVSAKFLATYISLKLRKNHYVHSVINPVKRELWRLSCRSFKKKKSQKKIIINILRDRKIRFLFILKSIFKIYGLIFYRNMKEFNTLITMDLFKFKMDLRVMQVSKKLKQKFLVKLIKINIYFYFFYGKLQNNLNIRMLEFKTTKNLKSKSNIFHYYFIKLNNFFYTNIKKFRIINVNFLLVNSNIIKYLVNFKFFKYIWIGVNKFNRRDARKNRRSYKARGLVAFKMALKGRFSRKQRASSIWYAHGRASLNRLNIKVDYAFVKVPLKNSIVSIKIWLFKNYTYDKFKYILNF